MALKAAMVADSDWESDIDVAPSQCSPSSPRKDQGQTLSDVDLGVNFSDFLSESQKLDMTGTHNPAPQEDHSGGGEQSTGTTASLKRQIESEQRKLAEQQKTSSSSQLSSSSIKFRTDPHSSDSPTVAKTKRRHSELATTGATSREPAAKSKRQNTYGSSSSSHFRSSQSILFMEEHLDQDGGVAANDHSRESLENSSGQRGGNDRPISLPTDPTAKLVQPQHGVCSYTHEPDPALHDHNAIQPPEHRDHNVNRDAFKDYVQMSSGRISTSRSLMGNYESINLDFRGNGTGLDVNTNPFGEASQNSVEDHHDRTDQQRREAIFSPPTAGTMSTRPIAGDQDNKSYSLGHSFHGLDQGTTLQNSSPIRTASARSKSYIDSSVLTKQPPDDSQEPLSSKSASRKRRKTADGLAVEVTREAEDEHGFQPAVAEVNLSFPRAKTQGKKRGRKPKNQAPETKIDLQAEMSEEQHEKGKGGSGKGDLAEKNPSSPLLLDDELAIGLPKEQYKPRPSRSRSKRTDEEAMPPPASSPIKSAQTPVKQDRTSAADDTCQVDDPEDTPLTKLRKGKKRKNKIKRAKTSAAALLKQSEKMLSDGEDDVVWVESKPATVKMKLPDPLEVKREEGKSERSNEIPCLDNSKAQPADNVDVASNEQSKDDPSNGASETSVDIPQAEDEPAAVPPPQPKKRGRKKKSIPIEVEIPPPSEDKNEDEQSNSNEASSTNPPPTRTEPQVENLNSDDQPITKPLSSSRPPLASKNPNITTSTPQKTKANAEENTTTTTTPSPTKPTPTTEKGPTKHSPINPVGGKVRYRVGLSRRAAIPPLLKVVRK